MESRRRKGVGVVHSVEPVGRDRDKGEARVTVVCLRDAGSNKYGERPIVRPIDRDGVATK